MGFYEGALGFCAMVYGGVLAWLGLGLRRRGANGGGPASVAVVVAARNEASAIGACLDSLRAQDYPGPIEVVVVDDRSEDDTAAQVNARAWPGLRLLRAPEAPVFRCGKKSALAHGISQTQAELLLFTDADCRPPPDWVRRTTALFAPGVGMAIGHAFPHQPRTWLQRLLALDNLVVGALGAGSTGMGRPLSCTGRNLAYRRAVYEEVGGFSAIGHWVGGDDVFFMRLVAATPWRVVVNDTPVAGDAGPGTWGAAMQQKLRHASKAGRYRGPALVTGAIIYLFHALLATGVIRALGGAPEPVFLGVWAGRWLADALVLAQYASRTGQRVPWVLLPIFEVVYIPYVLLFTLVGRLGWFRWK